MTIPFKNIPSNNRVPLFYAELDPSRANTSQQNQRVLIIGQMFITDTTTVTGLVIKAGDATPGVPVLSAGPADAAARFGWGSQAHLMVMAYRAADNFGELWVLPIANDLTATPAVGHVYTTAPPTGAGTVSLYIGGVALSVHVDATMTADNVHDAIVAAINNSPVALPVTAHK